MTGNVVADDKEMTRGPRGIGGFLILPAIGLVVSPFIVLGAIIQNLALLNGSEIGALEVVYPGFTSALVGQTIIHAGFLLFQLFVAVVFYMKKSVVPPLMVVLLLVNLVVTFVIVAWTRAVIGRHPEDISEVVRAVVLALIWVPYFSFSKRVKNTFA